MGEDPISSESESESDDSGQCIDMISEETWESESESDDSEDESTPESETSESESETSWAKFILIHKTSHFFY